MGHLEREAARRAQNIRFGAVTVPPSGSRVEFTPISGGQRGETVSITAESAAAAEAASQAKKEVGAGGGIQQSVEVRQPVQQPSTPSAVIQSLRPTVTPVQTPREQVTAGAGIEERFGELSSGSVTVAPSGKILEEEVIEPEKKGFVASAGRFFRRQVLAPVPFLKGKEAQAGISLAEAQEELLKGRGAARTTQVRTGKVSLVSPGTAIPALKVATAKADIFLTGQEIGTRERLARQPGRTAAEFAIGAAGGAAFKVAKLTGATTVATKFIPKAVKQFPTGRVVAVGGVGLLGGSVALTPGGAAEKGRAAGELGVSVGAIGGGVSVGGRAVQAVSVTRAVRAAQKSVTVSDISLGTSPGGGVGFEAVGKAVIDKQPVSIAVTGREQLLPTKGVIVGKQLTKITGSSGKVLGRGTTATVSRDVGFVRFTAAGTTIKTPTGITKTKQAAVTAFEKPRGGVQVARSFFFGLGGKAPTFQGLGKTELARAGVKRTESGEIISRQFIGKQAGVTLPKPPKFDVPKRFKQIRDRGFGGKRGQISILKPQLKPITQPTVKPQTVIPRTAPSILKGVRGTVGEIAGSKTAVRFGRVPRPSVFPTSVTDVGSKGLIKTTSVQNLISPIDKLKPITTTLPKTTPIIEPTQADILKPRTAVTPRTVFDVPTPFPTGGPGKFFPDVTPPPIRTGTGFFPPLFPPGGGGFDGRITTRKGAVGKTQFRPSFVAAALGIFGKPGQKFKTQLTGTELRPIPIPKTAKAKKRIDKTLFGIAFGSGKFKFRKSPILDQFGKGFTSGRIKI